MGKAILVMDMKDECCHCEFIVCNSNGEFVCTRDKDFHGELDIYKKPDWCPLKSLDSFKITDRDIEDYEEEHDFYLSEKLDSDCIETLEEEFAYAWNSAIDRLKGDIKEDEYV